MMNTETPAPVVEASVKLAEASAILAKATESAEAEDARELVREAMDLIRLY